MSLLQPQSIAVIGASPTKGKVGHDILQNLLQEGFVGAIYPINPKHTEILGKKTFATVTDVPETIELALIVVPATLVPDVLQECIQKNIQSIVIISAGFSETGTEEGKILEEKLKEIVAANPKLLTPSPTVIGPNCLGILRPSYHLNASFASHLPPEGSIGLISQSGAMAVALMDSAKETGLGFSSIISIGNATFFSATDSIELLGKDDKTKVIGLYIESISDGNRLLETCRRVGKKKKIVIIKAGVSTAGAKAALSHTGALAGSDAAIDALCAQSGAIRAHTMQEFLDLLEVLQSKPPLLSPNIAIITNAGGPGILATDATEKAGLLLPSLSTAIEKELQTHLPATASTKNPIDIIGDADLARFVAALHAVGNDPNIDGVAILLTPQIMTPVADIANAIQEWKQVHPTMPIVTSFMGDEHVKTAKLAMQQAGIPALETPERAIKALSALLTHNSSLTTRDSSPCLAGRQVKSQVSSLRQKKALSILKNTTGLLPEDATQKLFALYDIPLPQQKVAITKEEAVTIAKSIGYPVIAKISSPDIVHKTDIGGIKANLQSDDNVRNAYDAIMAAAKKVPNARIRGVLIQQFLPAGNEFIVGATADASFGHLLMAGLGGIYTELLQDTAFRIAPIDAEESYRLLQELISWKLLLGARGSAQLDIDSLASLLCSISALVTECPQITDIDINPVLVSTKGIVVADAKLVIA